MIKLVDYWAVWCQPCKIMAPVIEELEKEFPNLQVEKINVDEEVEKAQEANIMGIPTMLFYKDDVLIKRITGVTPKEELRKLIEDNLDNDFEKVVQEDVELEKAE